MPPDGALLEARQGRFTVSARPSAMAVTSGCEGRPPRRSVSWEARPAR